MSALSREPIRPNLPIRGRTAKQWGDEERTPLVKFFHELKNRSPHDLEWQGFVDEQYKLQLEYDQEPPK